MFVLEALEARHGDCLLLHYGDDAAPRLVVIDGGPSTVYANSLKPRLEALKDERAPDAPLDVELVMVSHIDDDHIDGILDWTGALIDAEDRGNDAGFNIKQFWLNSFDDIVGNVAKALTADMAVVATAGLQGSYAASGLDRWPAAVLASVNQGRRLRDHAERLGWKLNGGKPFVMRPKRGKGEFKFKPGLTLRVLHPSEQRLIELQAEWDKKLKALKKKPAAERAEAIAAAIADPDKSPYNLSSIVVLAEHAGKRMLLTGDALSYDVIEGLEQAGLLEEGGSVHFDVLKMPHHGSDRNVDEDFFRRVTADHYVVSGNGEHGNPEPNTFKMLFNARPDGGYAVCLTNAGSRLSGSKRKAEQIGVEWRVRDPSDLGIAVSL